ncbi:glycoside hydrolase family 36 protein [Pontiella sulfatireligans]|uniref:Alpha-galactosidase n=1 Tax=Pontiella sulfatireligans TaxID=2750658 RepID=A0A6C2ULC0_9BACT|nr:glycoside hydrolase family 36 protein [Pontiella sulfatireligans]VGO20693.1 Alpha-galactosidase [Pontiella sulfatireligans]
MKQIVLGLIIGANVFAGARAPSEWNGITVDVAADHPVEASQKLKKGKDGFQRLEIMLSNKGSETLTIESIEVRIPVAAPIADDMDLVYGSSCMGRRPMLRHKVGEPQKKSESFMYTMVQLAADQYVFAGSLSWRIFLPVFTLEDNAFVVRSDGEGKQLKPGESIQYEQIVLNRSVNWLALLDTFGEAIAQENGIRKLKDVEFKGWATWDYYGRIFSKEDIFGNMDELNKLDPECNLIQIDGGWWTERGDYTSVRDGLPGGIKAIVDRIVADGKIPGLHFDGFRGDAASKVCKTHPEYFLHDQDGKMIVHTKKLPDREMNYTFFDYSHPGARAHIAECVRTMKEEWGVRYFKVDFMRYGLETDFKEELNVKKVVAHDPSLTGVERFRLGMQTIRDAIGQENYFLGCSAVFGPCIGFVDGMRTGGDVHPRYEAFPERCQANTGNFYLAGKVYNGDCDYLVFREAADEDDKVFKAKHKFGGSMSMNEAQMWANYNKLYGNCRLASDNLMTLRPERKALVKEVFDSPAMDETVPLDFWQHGKDKTDGYELLLGRRGEEIFFGMFNWSDEAKAYDLPAFGNGGVQTLEAHHSLVLPYEGNLSFDELCNSMIESL